MARVLACSREIAASGISRDRNLLGVRQRPLHRPCHSANGSVMAANGRAWDIDALRGLMLVLMTATHLPTRFAAPLGQPFGYVSAAEGFVLLSGFMAGLVYMKRHQRDGETEMRAAFLKRALKIYSWQVVLLVFLFTIVALVGSVRQEAAIENMLTFYWEHPLLAFVNGLFLLYNPPLLDILPMYILFMLTSAPLLLHGLRSGWAPILGASLALWIAAQFDVGERLYEWLAEMAQARVPPVGETGSFSIAAWQFLWVLGLWMGGTKVATAENDDVATPPRFPRWMVRMAIVIAIAGLAWRHGVGQAPFGGDVALNLLFDKWKLGPLRILNLLALLLLVVHYGPLLRRVMPRFRFLETLGAASLAVFVGHLVVALLALAYLGAASPERPLWIDIALFVGGFAILYLIAWTTQQVERRSAPARGRVGRWAAQGSRALISRRHSA